MSNPAALLKTRPFDLSDGICLERADRRESAAEEFLRALITRLPSLKPRATHLRGFIAQANEYEATIRALDDAGVAAQFGESCLQMRREGFCDRLLANAF